MTTITNAYPDISSITILEKATVALARKILDAQQDILINVNNIELITISQSETNDTIAVSVPGSNATLRGKLEGGMLKIDNPFPTATFTSGTGTFPFNGTHLVEAFVYLVLYQSGLELSPAKNTNAEAIYCSVAIETGDEVAAVSPLTLTLSITDAPLTTITNADGSQSSSGKEYLL